MSAIGGKADIVWHVAMSANDPKRTLRLITDIAILDLPDTDQSCGLLRARYSGFRVDRCRSFGIVDLIQRKEERCHAVRRRGPLRQTSVAVSDPIERTLHDDERCGSLDHFTEAHLAGEIFWRANEQPDNRRQQRVRVGNQCHSHIRGRGCTRRPKEQLPPRHTALGD